MRELFRGRWPSGQPSRAAAAGGSPSATGSHGYDVEGAVAAAGTSRRMTETGHRAGNRVAEYRAGVAIELDSNRGVGDQVALHDTACCAHRNPLLAVNNFVRQHAGAGSGKRDANRREKRPLPLRLKRDTGTASLAVAARMSSDSQRPPGRLPAHTASSQVGPSMARKIGAWPGSPLTGAKCFV